MLKIILNYFKYLNHFYDIKIAFKGYESDRGIC